MVIVAGFIRYSGMWRRHRKELARNVTRTLSSRHPKVSVGFFRKVVKPVNIGCFLDEPVRDCVLLFFERNLYGPSLFVKHNNDNVT